MNDILKQRLVGALVLIALGVVFWPVIFIETDRGALDRSSQLQPMPRLEDVVIPAPTPLDNVEPVARADEIAAAADPDRQASVRTEPNPEPQPVPKPEREQAPAPSPQAEAEPEPAKTASPAPAPQTKPAPKPAAAPLKPAATPASPALDEDGIPIAWVLQVASLSSRDKADELTAQLIAQDYKAYSRAIRRDDEVLYRVFVGPVFEREKLALAKKDIDRQLQVSAIIARYVP